MNKEELLDTLDFMLNVFEQNINDTFYAEVDARGFDMVKYDDIINFLKESHFGDAESKVLASAVKYLVTKQRLQHFI